MDGIFLSLTSPSSMKILGMSAQTKSPPAIESTLKHYVFTLCFIGWLPVAFMNTEAAAVSETHGGSVSSTLLPVINSDY